ncbi:MAG TPA: thioesterase family protein [Steroidobacteraceae bacterium]|nr:thioesterase family protein [Steroidobacteraceae bacterium]
MTPGLAIYRTQVLPEWIDFNGHLRDAYYVLVVSCAADALMDHLGMDAAYRERTRCTLYTLEMHIHYFHEVMQSDLLEVTVRIIAADAKRIHAGFELGCARLSEAAASFELMLLHVEQGEKVAALPFPEEIARALETLRAATADATPARRGSRTMQLRAR